MIEVEHLCKSYDGLVALNDVGFRVGRGEVIGLLGPNGAGKTTLMKIITGYLHPGSGSVRVGGVEVMADPHSVQDRIGYLPENAPLYPELTVQSQLLTMARLRGIPEGQRAKLISDAVRAVGLADRLTRPISTLSKGYRQRVGLAQAILHQPDLLILDEPTNGLDPTQIVEVRSLIRKIAKNATVLLSTHILSEVEATCDRALIIIAGELKADSRLDELSGSADLVVSFVVGDSAAQKEALAGIAPSGVRDEASPESCNTFRIIDGGGRGAEVFDLARQNDWRISELKKEGRSLENVFNRLTAAGGEK